MRHEIDEDITKVLQEETDRLNLYQHDRNLRLFGSPSTITIRNDGIQIVNSNISSSPNSILSNEIVPSVGCQKSISSPLQHSLLNVLLVEDNKLNQKIVYRILSKCGHTCEIVENGLAACHAVHQKNFDMILMDIQMPVMDGISATERIRAAEQEGRLSRRNIIIALSSSPEHRERCFQVGMNDFLTKPVTADTLLQTLYRFQPSQ